MNNVLSMDWRKYNPFAWTYPEDIDIIITNNPQLLDFTRSLQIFKTIALEINKRSC